MKSSGRKFATTAIVVSVLLSGGNLFATNYFVTVGGNDSASGLDSGANAWGSISNAVAKMSNADVVTVGDGTYLLTDTINVPKNITIQSANGWQATTVDAQATSSDPRRVFYISGAGAKLDGFTIRGGCMPMFGRNYSPAPSWPGGVGGGACTLTFPGSGIYMTGGTVTNCHITANSSYGLAAGVWMTGGVLGHCLVSSNVIPSRINDGCCNYSDGVGGVYCQNGTVQNCEIFSNDAIGSSGNPNSGGAGIQLWNGKLLNSIVKNNKGDGTMYVSGVFIGSGPSVVSNCLVYGNSNAFYAAGMGASSSAGGSTIIDCIVTNNGTSQFGMEIQAAMAVRNTLVAKNGASGSGARFYASGSVADNCTIAGQAYGINRQVNGSSKILVLRNCIIHANAAGFQDQGASLSEAIYLTNCVSRTLTGDATFSAVNCILTNDPGFMNSAAGDFSLAKGSPCIDQGTNLDWIVPGVMDLAKNPRITQVIVDIGAYEYQHPPLTGSLLLIQ